MSEKSRVLAVLLAFSALAVSGGIEIPAERMEARREFSELKFGIFLHWGIYALFAQGEWYLEKGDGGIVEAEYAKACREKSARSTIQNRQEDYNSYFTFMKTQLTELLTNYGDILCVWFDGEWDHDPNDAYSKGLDVKPLDWRLEELYAHIHSLQPRCLVLNNHHHVMREGEDIQGFERDAPGENKAGLSAGQKVQLEFPRETCDTMFSCLSATRHPCCS